MKKTEVIKKIKEDLKFFTGAHDDLLYVSDYIVKTEVKLVDGGRIFKVPTGEEEFVITITLKRK